MHLTRTARFLAAIAERDRGLFAQWVHTVRGACFVGTGSIGGMLLEATGERSSEGLDRRSPRIFQFAGL